MSEELEFSTCRIDPEIDLIEEVLPPGDESESTLVENADALTTLDDAELAEAEKAIEERRAAAAQLPASEVQPFRFNALLVKQNVDAGYRNLQPHLAALAEKLPRDMIEKVERIRATALALVFVAATAAREAAPPPTNRASLTRVYKLRRLFLKAAETLAEAGLVDAPTVALIKEGSGPRDAVDDLVALRALFREQPHLLDKTPITEAMLREAADLAAARYPNISVPGGQEAPKPPPQGYADLRDRLWTLLLAEFDALFAVGAAKWGTKVTRHISPLQSRSRTTRAASEKPEPPARTGTE